MKLSTRTRYGIRAIVELAQYEGERPLQLKAIAERQDISVKYLEQLMGVLRSAGLVRSVRGSKGGYVLARLPEQIRLSEVFHCLEGPITTTECAAREVWTEVEAAINRVLDAITLADMVEKARVRGADYQI
jgi:Rrf2 family cysteine metabolism transcriptional repressor